MPAYMFQMELREVEDEGTHVFAEQRRCINKLFSESSVTSYCVAQNGKSIWCVVNADTEKDAMEVIAGFPLRTFFTDVVCHLLLFYDTVPLATSDISLN
jgi:hypothetical protein